MTSSIGPTGKVFTQRATTETCYTRPRSRSRRSRRAVLGATGGICLGSWLLGRVTPVAAQDDPITIGRDVGDRIVLPADPNTTVTGWSTLQPNTDFLVRVFSQGSPAFVVESEAIVAENGTWQATMDLTIAVDDQTVTVEAVFNGDVVASATGVIGPLSASVRFDDQQLSRDTPEVVISDARLDVGGFVVVTEGPDGPIVGVSDYLDAETLHPEIRVSLGRMLDGFTRLVATARLDVDGDRAFEPAIDRPYPEGNPVSDSAIVESSATPTPTDTPAPPPSGGGADVLLSVIGGGLGTLTVRATARVARRIGRRFDGENNPPIPQMVHIPEQPRPGVPVLFDGTLSVDPDPDDSVERYEWTIGEAQLKGPRNVHVFGSAEDHTVELRVRDGAGAESRTTETVTVEPRSSHLELEAVDPNASTSESLRNEYVQFRNVGENALEMSEWSISDGKDVGNKVDPGPHTFRFPDRFTLSAGESVAVHTGTEPTDSDDPGRADHHLYWNAKGSVWSAEADCLVVADSHGSPVIGARYERIDEGEYDIERVEAGALEPVFDQISVDESVRIPLLGVTVGPRIGVKVVRNGIEFVASGLFLRDPGAFARAWAQITAFLVLFLCTWLVSTGMGLVQPSIDATGPLLAVLGSSVVTAVGGVTALLSRLYRWFLDRLS